MPSSLPPLVDFSHFEKFSDRFILHKDKRPLHFTGEGQLVLGSHLDPLYHLSLSAAHSLAQQYSLGIGYSIPRYQLVLDLDNAFSSPGKLKLWAQGWLDGSHTVTEISPSGKGLHQFFALEEEEPLIELIKATKKVFEIKDGKIELLKGEAHYVTITGVRYQ